MLDMLTFKQLNTSSNYKNKETEFRSTKKEPQKLNISSPNSYLVIPKMQLTPLLIEPRI